LCHVPAAATTKTTATTIVFLVVVDDQIWASLTMTGGKRWDSAEDKKLAELFRKDKKLAYELDTKSIQQVHRAHWPDREFGSFSPLFRRKARQWQVNRTVSNKRKGKEGK
jgi:hypothetical protein